MRILLAEDDAQLGDAVASFLKRAGYAVDWLRDGVAVDTSLRGQRFELVILDLVWPRMAGRAVLERLRDWRETVSVLIITAQGALADRSRVLPCEVASSDRASRSRPSSSSGHWDRWCSCGSPRRLPASS